MAGDRKSKIRTAPGYAEALRAATYIRSRSKLLPRVGLVLGSGLGGVAGRLRRAIGVPYATIPHFSRSTVRGHAGELHIGLWGRTGVAILAGRMHLYEGHTPAEVVLPVRALALAGIRTLVVTCAAGGISRDARPGALMIFSDHLNCQGVNPLVGPEDERLGSRFVDMSQAYDESLRRSALRAARRLGLKCFPGIYAGLLGPSFETPAEIRALERLGADAVGMSTVPEVIAARQLGVRVLAIASITNRAAGLSRRPLGHDEVLEAGRSGAERLMKLLDAVLADLQVSRNSVDSRSP